MLYYFITQLRFPCVKKAISRTIPFEFQIGASEILFYAPIEYRHRLVSVSAIMY